MNTQLIVSKQREDRRYKHGLTDTNLYWTWGNMHARCKPHYPQYGARGITVCKRWSDFSLFAADMGPHPGKGWSLDRKNNNGNYSKRNCRWATQAMQCHNQQKTRLSMAKARKIREIYARGKTRQKDIAARFGVNQSLVSMVVRRRVWK